LVLPARFITPFMAARACTRLAPARESATRVGRRRLSSFNVRNGGGLNGVPASESRCVCSATGCYDAEGSCGWIHLGERALFARRRALHGRCQFSGCLRSTVYNRSSLYHQPLAPRERQLRGRRLEAGWAGTLLVNGAVNPVGRGHHPWWRAHHPSWTSDARMRAHPLCDEPAFLKGRSK
jgi:hypothetical protein